MQAQGLWGLSILLWYRLSLARQSTPVLRARLASKLGDIDHTTRTDLLCRVGAHWTPEKGDFLKCATTAIKAKQDLCPMPGSLLSILEKWGLPSFGQAERDGSQRKDLKNGTARATASALTDAG
jgi:hypothetical protein